MAPITKAPAPNASCWPAGPGTGVSPRPLPASLRRPHRLPWRPRLLRPPTRPRRYPPPSPPRPRQPARRHPARLPAPPHHLPRRHRLAERAPARRLTPSSRGMSRSFPKRSPSTPPSPAPRRRAVASAWRSPAPNPSTSWRPRPSTRRTSSATGSRSAPPPPARGRRRHVLALAQQPIGLGELAHHLLGCVPFPRRHRDRAFLPNTWAARLSPNPDQPAGVTSIAFDLTARSPSAVIEYRLTTTTQRLKGEAGSVVSAATAGRDQRASGESCRGRTPWHSAEASRPRASHALGGAGLLAVLPIHVVSDRRLSWSSTALSGVIGRSRLSFSVTIWCCQKDL